MEYTAIIGVYAGVENVRRIVTALQEQTAPPKEIIIWANANKDKKLDPDEYKDCTVINSSVNGGCYTRYGAVYLASTEFIMMLDDDTIPGKRWGARCLAYSMNHKDIIGSRGICLQRDAYRPNITIDPIFNNCGFINQVDIVGHCTFFPRTYVKYMFEHIPSDWTNGEDIQFCAEAMRNGKRVVVLNQDNNDQEGLGSIDRDLGVSPGRISTSDDTLHYSTRDKLCELEIKERHWIPTFKTIGIGKVMRCGRYE